MVKNMIFIKGTFRSTINSHNLLENCSIWYSGSSDKTRSSPRSVSNTRTHGDNFDRLKFIVQLYEYKVYENIHNFKTL